MMTLLDLQIRAESQGIRLYDMPMRELAGVSFPDGWIAIDAHKTESRAEEKVILAHEIGHCETGSFYNIYSSYDVMAAHEHRADVRSYKLLVPHDELKEAVKHGYKEVWELAELFDVPCDYMAQAMAYWQNEELAAV